MSNAIAVTSMRQSFASNIRFAVLFCTALTPVGVHAQDAPVVADQATSEGDQQLAEIVVTAQRREQNLQDTPVAVTAFGASELQASGVMNVKELAHVEPSLNVGQVVGVYLPFLRGIGNAAGGNLGNESSVPVYIDDVYYTRLSTAYLALGSIDRVEVLKGPQGTLFGRNSSGGAIQMFTKDPGQDLELNATIGYANYDTISGKLYASVPLTETLSWNISAGGSDQRSGWGKNLTTGDDVLLEKFATVRSKLVWEPSSSTRVKLVGFYAYTKGDLGMVSDRHSGTYGGTPAVTLPGYPNPPVALPSLADVPGDHFYDTRLDLKQVAREEGYGGSIRIDQDIDFADLVSITAFRNAKGLIRLDTDLSAFPFQHGDLNHEDRQITQEFQLKSKSGSVIDWIVGAYYLRSRVAYVPVLVYGDLATVAIAPGATQSVFSRQLINSYSGFGQATAPLGEKTNVTLGLRYTNDKVSGFGRVTATIPSVGTIPIGADFRASKTYRRLTWKGVVDHHFSDDVMAYASVSRGYKSGTFKTLPLDGPPALPEIVDTYELGIKSEFLDRRIRINGALFWNDIKNPQVLTVVNNGVTSGIALTNAEKARVRGGEIGIEAIAADGLKLRGALTYLDGEYVKYANAPFYCQNGVTIVGPATAQQGAAARCPVPADGASGNRLPSVPRWRYDLGANYVLESGIGKWVGDVGLSHTGKFAWNPDNAVFEKSVTLVNASLSFTPASAEGLTISLWGKNLGGVEYYSITQESVGPFGTGGWQSGAAAPRTYGGSISVEF